MPKGRLFAEDVCHANGAVHEPAAAHQFPISFVSIEHKVTAADPAGLFVHQPVVFPHRQPHASQPGPHAASDSISLLFVFTASL